MLLRCFKCKWIPKSTEWYLLFCIVMGLYGIGCVIGTSSGELPGGPTGLKADGGKDTCGDKCGDWVINE